EWGTSHMLRRLGLELINQGNYQQAVALLEEALSLARQAKAVNAIAWSLFLLGNVAWFQDRNSARAMAADQECLSFPPDIREMPFWAGLLFMKGEVARADGHYDLARKCYVECLVMSQEMQLASHWIAQTLTGFVGLALAGGWPQNAARLLGAIDTLAQQSSS